MTTERALLTGVTGFVGAHLARALVADHVEVHAIVRTDARLDRIPDLVEAITLHVDDGSTNALTEAVARARPDAAFHLATNFIAEHRADDITALVRDNVAFPTRLADAVSAHSNDEGGAATFVNVGTAWQHVDGASYQPKNLYAATKQAFEDVLRFYSDRALLRVVTVNIYDSYGPLDHRGKLLTHLLAALRTGEPLLMSSGQQLIDLVHVDDITAALRRAADLAADTAYDAGAREPAIYALSSGEPRTLRQLVELLGEVAGSRVPVVWGARPDRAGDMIEHWRAGDAVPGWSPSIDLPSGLRSLLALNDH